MNQMKQTELRMKKLLNMITHQIIILQKIYQQI